MKNKSLPVGDIFYGDFITGYEAKRSAKEAWQLELAALVRLLSDFQSGTQVLDVPYGTGRFIAEYIKRGMNVTGVDISPEMFEEARRTHGELLDNCQLVVGSSVTLPFEDNSFDLVVSFRFLSGIVNSGAALDSLKEFARVAQHGIFQLKCRPEQLPPIKSPASNEKLSKRYYRRDYDDIFSACGWRVESSIQIDEDLRGNRWAFLCVRNDPFC